MQVVVVGPGEERKKTTMDRLLPEAFSPADLDTPR
jgi:cytidine deaminase